MMVPQIIESFSDKCVSNKSVAEEIIFGKAGVCANVNMSGSTKSSVGLSKFSVTYCSYKDLPGQ
jgi:hypothetical protein